MADVDTAQDPRAGEPRGDDRWSARRPGRTRKSKPAQIAYGATVLDCVLLDVSPGGAQACLKELADVPDLVTLRLPGGESWPVRCCWQNGIHVGFEVVGTEPLALPAD